MGTNNNEAVLKIPSWENRYFHKDNFYRIAKDLLSRNKYTRDQRRATPKGSWQKRKKRKRRKSVATDLSMMNDNERKVAQGRAWRTIEKPQNHHGKDLCREGAARNKRNSGRRRDNQPAKQGRRTQTHSDHRPRGGERGGPTPRQYATRTRTPPYINWPKQSKRTYF